MVRRALLLALDNYSHSRLAPLQAPRNDGERLREALLGLGYANQAIDLHISSRNGELSTQRMRTRIRDFVESGKPNDELLIYISGHGMDQDAARLVVPVDYDMDDPMPADQLLSDHWLYGTARASKAEAVLVIADTCRSGAELVLRPTVLSKDISERPTATAPSATHGDAPTIAILYSCAKGRKSFATDGEAGESFFTRELCRVLADDKRAFTLGEVVDAVTQELAEAEAHHRQQPFLDERFTLPGRRGVPTKLVIKENEAARLSQRIDLSPWCRMLKETPFWPTVVAECSALGWQLLALAVRAETMLAEASRVLPGDRWRTDAALRRVYKGIEHLLGQTPVEAELAAMLLAAPLVHEAILAGLVLRLAAAGPVLDPPRAQAEPTASALAARAWRQALDRDDDFERRRAHLRLSGSAPQADDLLVWQLWSFAYGAGELWAYAPEKPAGASGWLNDQLNELLVPGITGQRNGA
jgi:hypothetical protein